MFTQLDGFASVIPLAPRRGANRGHEYALVDVADSLLVEPYCWRQDRHGYAWACADGVTVYMHRLIVRPPSGVMIDHINGAPWDNRRANLRLADHAQNMRNRKLGKNNKSGFVGVSYSESRRGWIAKININGRKVWLGTFDDASTAAMARDAAARIHYGAFGSFNFPRPGERAAISQEIAG
jgi:hypothetical protein